MDVSEWEFAGADDYVPSVFDPLGWETPEYEQWTYDEDMQQIIDANAQPVELSPYEENLAEPLIANGISPLSKIIDFRKQEEEQHAPEDPVDLMPEQPFVQTQDGILFHDSSFAGPVLRSLQNTNQKGLTGWLILPATSVCRIRTKKGSHGLTTKVLWVPEINGISRESFK